MIEFHDPMNTPEGQILSVVQDLEKAVILKYQQEPTLEGAPTFMDYAGGQPVQASGGYTTNQTLPQYETDAPLASPISEVYSMPAFGQTGYDAKSSSLHMHLNDGGTTKGQWRDSFEEAMTKITMIKKNADVSQIGIIDEIGDLLTKIATRL